MQALCRIQTYFVCFAREVYGVCQIVLCAVLVLTSSKESKLQLSHKIYYLLVAIIVAVFLFFLPCFISSLEVEVG